jgi:hypothetical protein
MARKMSSRQKANLARIRKHPKAKAMKSRLKRKKKG